MPYLQINRDRLFYQSVMGSRQDTEYDAVVFLHSLGTDHRLWKYQVEDLQNEVPAIIALDAAGHGRSSWEDGIDLQRWVRDILQVLDQLNLKRVVLCGISMGGVEAIAFAELHPERVAGLILADTFAAIDPAERPGKIKLTAGAASEQGMDQYADIYLNATLSDSQSAGNIRAELRDAIQRMDVQAYELSAEACFQAELTDGLSAIQVPVLVLIGDEDLKTPIALSEAITSRIDNARLCVVPAARHLSNVDNPQEFNRLCVDFLQTIK